MTGIGFGDAINQLFRQALFLPPQAAERARSIDTLHYVEITLLTGVTMLVALVGMWFAWRYRRRPDRPIGEASHPTVLLELSIYGGLLSVFIALWVVGFAQYLSMANPPAESLRIYVTAKQWMWKFSYPDGQSSAGVLVVPTHTPVSLLLTSRDVIHSFYVPAFRLKRDAVPGTYTGIWFEAREAGRYPVFCTELCGVGHSRMRAEVVALPPDRYAEWLSAQSAAPAGITSGRSLVERGREVAVRQGCFACHTMTGEALIGPSWAGVFGSRIPLESGEQVLADEAYLTRSMMDPQAQIVAGFPRIMPSYQGLLEPADVAALVELIRSLAEPPPSGPPPAARGEEAGDGR